MKYCISLTLQVFAIAVVFLSLGCNPRNLPIVNDQFQKLDEKIMKETDEAIAKTPELQKLDAICTSIPKGEQFKLYSKRLAHNYPLTLFYSYSSSEAYDSADRRFKEYFAGMQWTHQEIGSMNPVSEYTKFPYRVTIQFGGMGPNATYGFSCEKSH